MLKNWTVITEATRDIMAREYYLMNANHRNHKHTEQIISLFGSAKQSLNILRNCERYKLKQAAKRKGGRPALANPLIIRRKNNEVDAHR
ncbi:hypothetical protein AB6D11_27560, partial [Vibrio splendidus]